MSRPDVCVIGGGAAGCVLALRLARRGMRVTVLESGPRYTDEQKEALFLGVRAGRAPDNPYRSKEPRLDAFRSDGEVFMPIRFERVRALGGTTLFWLGNCPRLLPADFEMRTRFGLADDWPIGYEDLETFYGEAEHEIGVAGADDNPFAGPRSAPYPMPPMPYSYSDRLLQRAMGRLGYEMHHTAQARNSVEYGGRSQCLSCCYCEACPSGAKATMDVTHARPAERTGLVRFLTDATVLRLELDAAGRVRRAVHAGLDRLEHAVEADVFVVASGGIEVPRLLLLSATRGFPEGLANHSGLVGRYLMNHPVKAVQGRMDEMLYTHRVHFESLESYQFYATADRDREPAFLIDASNMGGPTPARLAAGAASWGDELAERIREEFGHVLCLSAGVEQLPDPDNRVRLDPEEKDYFGLPVPRVTYGFDEYTRRGLQRAEAIQQEILEAAGARSFLPAELWWPGHHLGTVRMGRDPETSVVDADLRTHDVANLYLLTTGAFVTGGCANPTLTLAAMALRLAEHLAAGRAG